MSLEVLIEELSTIIAIEPKNGKRESFFDILDLFQRPCFPLSPDYQLFGPTGSDIYEDDAIGIHSRCGITAMGNYIGFQEARMKLVPLIGLDWYLLSQVGSWLGGCSAAFAKSESDRLEGA